MANSHDLLMAQRAAMMGGIKKDGIFITLKISEGTLSYVSPKVTSFSGTYDWDWGDGTVEVGLTGNPSPHTYQEYGTYVLRCRGLINIGKYFIRRDGISSSDDTVIRIEQFGESNIYNTDYNSCGEMKALESFVGNFKIGHDGTSVGGTFTKCNNLSIVELPECVNLNNTFDNCYKLRKVKVGKITNTNGYNVFQNCGRDLSIVEGYKTVVETGNTMDGLLNGSEYAWTWEDFPWRISTPAKFVCTDGYILYQNGSWVKHPYT